MKSETDLAISAPGASSKTSRPSLSSPVCTSKKQNSSAASAVYNIYRVSLNPFYDFKQALLSTELATVLEKDLEEYDVHFV